MIYLVVGLILLFAVAAVIRMIAEPECPYCRTRAPRSATICPACREVIRPHR